MARINLALEFDTRITLTKMTGWDREREKESMHQDTSYVSRTLTTHFVVQPVSHFSLIIVKFYVLSNFFFN